MLGIFTILHSHTSFNVVNIEVNTSPLWVHRSIIRFKLFLSHLLVRIYSISNEAWDGKSKMLIVKCEKYEEKTEIIPFYVFLPKSVYQ